MPRRLSAQRTRQLPKVRWEDIDPFSVEFIPRGTPAAQPHHTPHKRRK